jgi:hypothetical protein
MSKEKLPEAASKLVSGLCCPRCQELQVAALPPNGISPKPGYRCLSCGTRMRGMTGTYLVAVALGALLLSVATGVFRPFGDASADAGIRRLVSAPMGPGSQFFAVPFYLLMVGYAVRELVRPGVAPGFQVWLVTRLLLGASARTHVFRARLLVRWAMFPRRHQMCPQASTVVVLSHLLPCSNKRARKRAWRPQIS